MNNRRTAFSMVHLEALASSSFASLTLLNLVGRGEPMMVGLPLWLRLTELLRTHDVLMTCVTNGTFLRKRLTPDVLPLIDTLTLSIDGTDAATFAENRGGASLENWLNNLQYFNDMRRKSGLLRRPRLGLSWTLKRNNIHQFPDFIRLALKYDADLLYIRHLFVFHEKDEAQSLVGEPVLTNRYLREGYTLLKGHRMKLDAVPLSVETL